MGAGEKGVINQELFKEQLNTAQDKLKESLQKLKAQGLEVATSLLGMCHPVVMSYIITP